MKNTILILSLTFAAVACVPDKSEITVNMNKKNKSALQQASVSSVQIINNQLVINGSGFTDVTNVKVNGNSLNENFSIETKTSTKIIANSISAFSFDISKIFSLILSNANASATFNIDFSLCNATLNNKGFNCAAPVADKDVLAYDAVSGKWKPRPASGLNYLGTFDASSNPGSGPAIQPAGAYYVISDDGTIAAVSFAVGDWLVSNGSAWQKIDNSSAVLSVFGRYGAISSQEGDYTLDLLGDVSFPVAPVAGKVLKFNGTNWVAGDDLSGGGAGSVTTSSIADGAVTDIKINTVSASKITGTITSAQIADGTIVNADINAAAAIDYSKLNIANGEIPAAKISGLPVLTTILAATITNGDTAHAPDGNSVFDALATKLDKTGGTITTMLNVPPPVLDTEATTKLYVDTADNLRLNKTGGTVTGILNLDSDLKIKGGANYVTIRGHASSATYNLILPSSAGTSGYVLRTDGAGNLSWIDPGAVSTGTSTVDSSSITDGSIVNADISATAAIAQSKIANLTSDLAAKQSTTLTNGNILIGNGSNIATAALMSGDATMLNTGVVTLKNTGTIGTYRSVTTDAQGRVVSGTNPTTLAGYGIADTLVTSITATAPLVKTGTAAVPILSMPEATTAVDGYLSATDWTTFNNKQSSITAASNVSTATLTSGELRLNELAINGTNYVALKAPDNVASNMTFTLPAVDGLAGQILKTNGAGVLGWVTDNSGGGAFVGTINKAVATDGAGALTTVTTTATELGFVSGVTSAIQTQLNAKQASGNYVTALTGDVTATGPGSVAATVASVGGVTAVNVATGANLANAATHLNTASTIVKRDASGNFTAGTITATLSGNATNVTGTVAVANGGTGKTTLGLNNLLFGNTTSAVGEVASTTTPSVLLSTTATGLPTWTTSTAGNVLKGSVTGVVFGPLALADLPAGTLSGSGTTNYIPYYSAASTLANSPMAISGSSVGIGTAAPATALDINGAESMRAMAAPALSPLTQGRIYFDSTSNKYRVSQNGGAYVDLVSAGGGASIIDDLTDGIANSANGQLFLGSSAGVANTGLSNTAVGQKAMQSNVAGFQNSAFGNEALNKNTSGTTNAAFGMYAMKENTTGNDNASFGEQSLNSNQTGSENTAMGRQALYGFGGVSTHTRNTAVGYRAGVWISTGNNNTFLGHTAGDNVTTGSTNIVIGYDIDAPSPTASNQMTIGNLIYANGVNGTGTTAATGNVSIGSAAAANTKLNVEGQIRSKSFSQANGTVNWANGNSGVTSFDCGSNLTFASLRDGGSYTLAVTGTGTTQCSFSTTTTGDDATTVSYRFMPANAVRTASSHTIYSFQRIGTVVYVSWITGFL